MANTMTIPGRRALLCVAAAFAAVTVLLSAAPASAQVSPRDAASEARYEGELARLAPDAVPTFRDATARLDAGDPKAARALFEDVLRRAPAFPHAERRLCTTELLLGDLGAARRLCQHAVEKAPTAENHAALARVLVHRARPDANPTTSDLRAAEHHARRAVTLAPGEAYGHLVLAEVALASNDLSTLNGASLDAVRVAPSLPEAHVFRTIALASSGDFDGADAELETAHRLGLSDEGYRSIHAKLDEARPALPRVLRAFGVTIGAWLALLGVLFVLGTVLSRAALRSAARLPDAKDGHAHGTEALLRRIYRGVLWAAGALYYLSLPLVAVVTIGAIGAVIWGVFVLGYIPIKLIVVLGIAGLATLGAILKSLFVRVRDEDPGERIDLREHPRLRAALDEVAARIGTRPVDEVYLTPFSDVAVLERGGFARQLRGTSERALVLGAGVVDGMKVRAFKSVLAHEYGHFHNEDTAGGGFALAARRSMLAMAIGLAQNGAASPLNPAWWFVRGYFAVFLRISQGASRLQEVLADRWAAFAYGSEAFEEGMRHVVRRSISFDAHVEKTLGEVVEAKAALPNLYAYVPETTVAEEDVEKAVDEVWNATPSPYDSHPRPADRVAWARALASEGAPRAADDDDEVWALFRDRKALEVMMTDIVRARVALAHGARISGDVEPTAAE